MGIQCFLMSKKGIHCSAVKGQNVNSWFECKNLNNRKHLVIVVKESGIIHDGGAPLYMGNNPVLEVSFSYVSNK